QNAFVNESIFEIADGKKSYDAVYNARYLTYKRHDLAKQVDNLLLILTTPTEEQVLEVKKLLPQSTIANEQDGKVDHLSARAVSIELNKARCGLCLSKVEGAMFASIEYLLCGLPIVTTANVGGRNWYFSNEYVKFCDDNADAV